jgi:hypothetical protein
MQELRLVAVSEDGSYLVLATAGRGTRFTLPVDDRLRAAVRGHFSRLGQFEIEVESPLRPKEIQARIRAGETAEEIAETAGIPVERIRWFEGPVLQEREYMAQQAQRVVVRRPGETSPGPPLGEIVTDRLGRRGVDLDEVEWDSWKCEDSSWRVRLSFFLDGRPYAAEWMFDPRRRHMSALDEEAARLSSLELDPRAADTVTPLLPRRPAMKIVSPARDDGPAPSGPPRPPAPPVRESYGGETAGAHRTEPAGPHDGDLEEILAATRDDASGSPAGSREDERADPAAPAAATPAPAAASRRRPEPETARAAAAEARTERAPERPAAPRPKQGSERPGRAQPAAEHTKEERTGEAAQAPAEEVTGEEVTAEEVAEHVAAAANGDAVGPAAKSRNRRKNPARGKRASVPSWDEIMFGARRPD